MLKEYLGQKVVVDLKSEYVILGTLDRFDDHFIEIKNLDFHDLRDSETNRETYVALSHATGIKRNRKRVLLFRAEVVAVSLFDDIVDH